MFSRIAAALAGPYANLIFKVLGILFAAGTLGGLWLVHNHNVAQKALAKFNQQQLEQVIHDQEVMKKQLDEVKKIGEETSKALDDNVKQINERGASTEKKIDEIARKQGERPAPDVIKKALEELYKR